MLHLLAKYKAVRKASSASDTCYEAGREAEGHGNLEIT